MTMMMSLCKTQQCQIKPCKCLLRTALAYSAPGALCSKDMMRMMMMVMMMMVMILTHLSHWKISGKYSRIKCSPNATSQICLGNAAKIYSFLAEIICLILHLFVTNKFEQNSVQ